MNQHLAARDRSYGVRSDIAALIGAPTSGHDFHTHRYGKHVAVVLHDGTDGLLLSTSNAGFRGIEGTIQTAHGLVVVSLGEVASHRIEAH